VAVAVAIALCVISFAGLPSTSLSAEDMHLDQSRVYATPSTPKSDMLQRAESADALDAGSQADRIPSPTAKSVRVETVLGRLLPTSISVSPAAVSGEAASSSRSTGKAASLRPSSQVSDAQISIEPDRRTATTPDPSALAMTRSSIASTPPPETSEATPGEILWSNKTASLPSNTASDAAAPLPQGSRTMELAVPLRDGSFYLGDVSARIEADGAVSVPKERLAQIATPLLRTAALDKLKSIPDTGGYLPLNAVKENGFDVQFDPGKVEIQFAQPSNSARPAS
jgi:hypothetical protein